MQLVIPQSKLSELVNKLKDFEEVDILEDSELSEYYDIRINFTQKSYFIKPTSTESVFEDLFFLELILNHLKEDSKLY